MVKQKELFSLAGAVVYVSLVLTLGMVSAIFFLLLAEHLLRFSEIAVGLVATSLTFIFS